LRETIKSNNGYAGTLYFHRVITFGTDKG
jgi:hypothetical protein